MILNAKLPVILEGFSQTPNEGWIRLEEVGPGKVRISLEYLLELSVSEERNPIYVPLSSRPPKLGVRLYLGHLLSLFVRTWKEGLTS